MTHDLDTEERYRPDPEGLERQRVFYELMLNDNRLLAHQREMIDRYIAAEMMQPRPWWRVW